MQDTTQLWRDNVNGCVRSEDEVLELIDRFFIDKSPHCPRGRGDDCAELADLPSSLAVSTDMFWQDSHFRCAYFTPAEAGGKALSSAVSDLAATGAVPLGFSFGLLLPDGFSRQALEGLLSGMADRAAEYGIVLTGGDLTRGNKVGLSLCVWGRSRLPGGIFPRRGEARPGDCLFMTGKAGLARVGLWALERDGRAALEDWPEACMAHLSPRAMIQSGQAIVRAALVKGPDARLAMMDVSDGLTRDIPRLLAGFGADLAFSPDRVPFEVRAAATRMGLTPEEVFLLGGEDYCLLGACPPEIWPDIREAVPEAFVLGTVTENPGILLHGKKVKLSGFDHFGREENEPESVADAVQELIRFGKDAHKAGLMAGFNGNLSRRLGLAAGEAVLVTRSGAAKGGLEADDFLLLSLPGGEEIRGALPKSRTGASSESPMHLALYERCAQSRFILHCHPPNLLALSLAVPLEEFLVLPLPEAERYSAALAWVPFSPPGSEELAGAVAEAARANPAVWMERHGLVVHGDTVMELLALCEELEQLARVQLDTLSAVRM